MGTQLELVRMKGPQLEKHFGWVVLVLVAVAVYFQADGITRLVQQALSEETTASLHEPARPVSPPLAADSGAAHRPRSATALLARNPFDSATGSLGLGGAGPTRVPIETPPGVDDPLSAPRCEELRAHIITEAESPQQSSAALATEGGATNSYRIGDELGEKKVVYIGYNPLWRTPAVWLSGPESLCQVVLFDSAPGAAHSGREAQPATR